MDEGGKGNTRSLDPVECKLEPSLQDSIELLIRTKSLAMQYYSCKTHRFASIDYT